MLRHHASDVQPPDVAKTQAETAFLSSSRASLKHTTPLEWLQSAPRYQLYIYLLLLDKFFVAQDERALEASICDVRSQHQPSFS
jgi:hypothetical protein